MGGGDPHRGGDEKYERFVCVLIGRQAGGGMTTRVFFFFSLSSVSCNWIVLERGRCHDEKRAVSYHDEKKSGLRLLSCHFFFFYGGRTAVRERQLSAGLFAGVRACTN